MLAGSGQEPRGIESLRRVSRDNAVRGAVQLPAAVVEPAHPFQAYHQHSAREDHQETGATMQVHWKTGERATAADPNVPVSELVR